MIEDARRQAVQIDVVDNRGAGNFLRPTRLRLLNNGDDKAAAAQFPRWDLANGILLPGLRRRREAEAAFFSSVTAVGEGGGSWEELQTSNLCRKGAGYALFRLL